MATKPTKTKSVESRALAPTAKEAKFLRHCRRMGKLPSALISSGAAKTDPFGDNRHVPRPRSIERVVFSGQVKDNFPAFPSYPPIFVISDGVTIDVQARETDALATFRERRPGTFTQVVVTGKIPRIIASAYR